MQPTTASTSATPSKVVPLLAGLNRIEELTSSLAIRLDPIVVHGGSPDQSQPPVSNTVTTRIHQVGDALQYLLDNIEL